MATPEQPAFTCNGEVRDVSCPLYPAISVKILLADFSEMVGGVVCGSWDRGLELPLRLEVPGLAQFGRRVLP